MSVTIIRDDTNEALTLHAAEEQSHAEKVQIADHPVEDGADVTDHAEKTLETITIVGVVTETPFLRPNETKAADSLQAAARDFLKRAAEKILRLDTMRFGVIQPVLLESFPQTIDQTEQIQLELTFKEIRFARATTVEIPPEQTTEPGLASGVDVGSRGTNLREVLQTDDDPKSVFFDRGNPEQFLATRTFEDEKQTDKTVGQSWGKQILEGDDAGGAGSAEFGGL